MDKQLESMDRQIEEYMDSHGLSAVIESISRICYGKSEHLVSNWQDWAAAKEWERFGTKVERLASEAAFKGPGVPHQ